MRDLEHDIAIFVMQRGDKMYPGEKNIVEAARRVANPDFDAIDKSADEYAKLWGFNPSMIRQIMHLGAAQALGITEDTNAD